MAKEHRGLLYAASVDVETIDALASLGVASYAESIGYHAQQAAEKLVKSVFEKNNEAFPFTHNISSLLNRANDLGFLDFDDETLEQASYLSSLISLTRYADAPDFQEGEALDAMRAFEAISRMVSDNGYESLALSPYKDELQEGQFARESL